jgi:hypothetical protein
VVSAEPVQAGAETLAEVEMEVTPRPGLGYAAAQSHKQRQSHR